MSSAGLQHLLFDLHSDSSLPAQRSKYSVMSMHASVRHHPQANKPWQLQNLFWIACGHTLTAKQCNTSVRDASTIPGLLCRATQHGTAISGLLTVGLRKQCQKRPHVSAGLDGLAHCSLALTLGIASCRRRFGATAPVALRQLPTDG